MQNLGGQTKSIMVFSEVSYSKPKISPSFGLRPKNYDTLILFQANKAYFIADRTRRHFLYDSLNINQNYKS